VNPQHISHILGFEDDLNWDWDASIWDTFNNPEAAESAALLESFQ
jgi:hypothetical protein